MGRSRRKSRRAAAASAVTESSDWTGEWVDPRTPYYDDPTFFAGAFGTTQPTPWLADRKDGLNLPTLRTELDLQLARGVGRYLADGNPTGIGILRNLQNYVVGKGFKYTVAPADKTLVVDPSLIAMVQRCIDQFRDENEFDGDLDRELLRRDCRDGEYFLALYPVAGGKIKARCIEPEFIAEPDNPRDIEERYGLEGASKWCYGIHHDSDDVQSVRGFFVQWSENRADYDYLTTDIVQHSKGSNVDRNILRGVSDFFAVDQSLLDSAKLLLNTVRGAQIQAAIAYIVSAVAGTAKADVESVRDNAAVSRTTETTQLGSRQRNVERIRPGTIIRTGGQKYDPGPLGATHGPNFIAIHQAVLRIAGSRWCMPEYMISGDASNANYSSTLVAESPFVKNCEALQTTYKRRFGNIMWKAVQVAVNAGRLPLPIEELQALLEIQVEAPQVASRNEKEQADVCKIESDAGILSPKTWAARVGLDYDQEVAQGAEKQLPPDPFGDGQPGGDGRHFGEAIREDCGTGAGGFQPGNDCAGEGGGGTTSVAPPSASLKSMSKEQRTKLKAVQEKRLETHATKWVAKLNGPEKIALNTYTGGSENVNAETINASLRGCPETADCLDAHEKRVYQPLNAALLKAGKLPEPVQTFRGLDLKASETKGFVDQFRAAAKSGKSVSFAGFVSSSLDSATASDFAKDKTDPIFRIQAKSGAYIGSQSKYQGERELLQAHGTKYKVVQVIDGLEVAGKKRTVIDLVEL